MGVPPPEAAGFLQFEGLKTAKYNMPKNMKNAKNNHANLYYNFPHQDCVKAIFQWGWGGYYF